MKVSGDKYADMWPREQFAARNVTYEAAGEPEVGSVSRHGAACERAADLLHALWRSSASSQSVSCARWCAPRAIRTLEARAARAAHRRERLRFRSSGTKTFPKMLFELQLKSPTCRVAD
jgi:hypothetical protein